MCDDCTDRAWEHYYSLLEKVSHVVGVWEGSELPSWEAMEEIQAIVNAAEAD